MRAATAYMPKVGGQITMLSTPARQKIRISRSMASSLPAPDQQLLRTHAVEGGKSLHEHRWLRFGVAVESRLRCIAGNAPRQFVGVHAGQLRLPGRMLVGIEGEDVRPRTCQHGIHRGFSVDSAARRIVTALAWASSPSRFANVWATGPSRTRPAVVSSCTVIRFWKSVSERPL